MRRKRFQNGDPERADPYGSTTARTDWLTNMTFDTLVYNNTETGEIEPELAYERSSNETQDEWTFKIRDNVVVYGNPARVIRENKKSNLFKKQDCYGTSRKRGI